MVSGALALDGSAHVVVPTMLDSNGLAASPAGEFGGSIVLSSGCTITVTSSGSTGWAGGASSGEQPKTVPKIGALEVEAFEVEKLVAELVVCSEGLIISLAAGHGCSSVLSSGIVMRLCEWSIPVEEAGVGSGRALRSSAPVATASVVWALPCAEQSCGSHVDLSSMLLAGKGSTGSCSG